MDLSSKKFGKDFTKVSVYAIMMMELRPDMDY